jgi:hypothetical protein
MAAFPFTSSLRPQIAQPAPMNRGPFRLASRITSLTFATSSVHPVLTLGFGASDACPHRAFADVYPMNSPLERQKPPRTYYKGTPGKVDS